MNFNQYQYFEKIAFIDIASEEPVYEYDPKMYKEEKKLYEISGLTSTEAKDIVMKKTEEEMAMEIAVYIKEEEEKAKFDKMTDDEQDAAKEAYAQAHYGEDAEVKDVETNEKNSFWSTNKHHWNFSIDNNGFFDGASDEEHINELKEQQKKIPIIIKIVIIITALVTIALAIFLPLHFSGALDQIKDTQQLKVFSMYLLVVPVAMYNTLKS